MEKEKFYITTPIYYPSGNWHLGTCYTTVICDAIARYNRLLGKDVFYLTGTDEHGQKIEKVAKEAGMDTKEYIDLYVNKLKDLWKLLDISYDKFIRTTDIEHKKIVQKIFKKLYDKGDIYKSVYEGMYCTPCESFWTESQLHDGKCPDCGREVKKMKEESYFFRMTKYQNKLIELIENNKEFLEPKSRQNEMLNNFLKPGLQDLCVSRTSFKWGIEVPFDNKHVVYVWLDALTNYITALGYMTDDDSLFKKYWPADVHMMGKEIVRFHSIIWPAILMALDIELPKKVYGHGWLLFGQDKISKSKAAAVVDPYILSERYSSDAVRYYLLREVPFGQDGSFTNSSFIYRVNADLANTLGNLVSRVSAMTLQNFNGELPKQGKLEDIDIKLIEEAENLLHLVTKDVEALQLPDALTKIFNLLSNANKYVDQTEPWKLAKDESKKQRLATVLFNLLEVSRYAAVMLQAFIPRTAEKIFKMLSIEDSELKTFASLNKFGQIKLFNQLQKQEPLFLRLDVEKELKYLEEVANAKIKEKEEKKESNLIDLIGIDDFSKVKLIVGEVLEAEEIEKSKKLLKLKVDLGNGDIRTIASGIKQYYTKEEMLGKKIVVVSNLKACKLCGVESQGMILCASKGDKLSLISLDKSMENGSEVF